MLKETISFLVISPPLNAPSEVDGIASRSLCVFPLCGKLNNLTCLGKDPSRLWFHFQGPYLQQLSQESFIVMFCSFRRPFPIQVALTELALRALIFSSADESLSHCLIIDDTD